MIFFDKASLRRATREYVAHHTERNHQGLYNRLIDSTWHHPGEWLSSLPECLVWPKRRIHKLVESTDRKAHEREPAWAIVLAWGAPSWPGIPSSAWMLAP